MTPLFKKLNYKTQASIVVLNHPASFDQELKLMQSFTTIHHTIDEASFFICFAKTQKEVVEMAKDVGNKMQGDAIVWFCYPKGSSKKYTCDFNRDTGWAIMKTYNLETVRMVAIDEDWSALRFRKVDFIKNITRKESYAITNSAKKRTTQKGV